MSSLSFVVTKATLKPSERQWLNLLEKMRTELFTVQLQLTALVEPVQAVNVIPAHLGGFTKGNIAVWDRHHGRKAIFGEGIPGRQQTFQKEINKQTKKSNPYDSVGTVITG